MQRMRKLVGNPQQAQHKCRIPFQHWLNANQLPTHLANYRHLGFVSLLCQVLLKLSGTQLSNNICRFPKTAP